MFFFTYRKNYIKRKRELISLLKAGKIRNLKCKYYFPLSDKYINENNIQVYPKTVMIDFVYEKKTEPDTYGYIYWLTYGEIVKPRKISTVKIVLLEKKFNLKII